MRAIILFALGSSLAIAAACSSSSNEWSSCFCEEDAGYSPDSNSSFVDAGAPPSSYSSLLLDACYPNALPTDGGLVDCHAILYFPGAATCASIGFTNAPTADSTYLAAANGAPLPYGSFCALDQLPADACLADAGAGWCYVPGGCEPDAGCAQSLCASSGYTSQALVYTWLACP